MAEKETSTERKVIEMNIWFVIMLIVVIVFSAVFIKMSNDKKALVEQVTTITTEKNKYESKYKMLLDTCLELQNQVYSLAPDQLKEKLKAITGEEVYTAPAQPAVEVSGEALPSGEVVVE